MPAPVTPETLTDEMIHALWCEAGATQAARAFGHAVATPVVDMATCERAGGDGYWPGWRAVAAARQAICDAINARKAGV